MPACRLIVPDRQWFTDELLVGVMAAANNRGSLYEKLGLDRVRFHFEGETVDVQAPGFASFADANGNPVTYFGWWVRLKKPAGIAGLAHLYVEAVPSDPSMQNRVIGPYIYGPQDAVHDLELEVAPSLGEIPGQRYQSVGAAILHAHNAKSRNPRVTITEANRYVIGDNNKGWVKDGRCTIEASTPGVVFGKSDYLDDSSAQMNPGRFAICFRGENITLDFAWMSRFNMGNLPGLNHWCDGVTLTNSRGQFALWRGGVRVPTSIVEQAPWFTECTIEKVESPVTGASLVRGCTVRETCIDVASGAECVLDSTFIDHSNERWNTENPAFTVQYNGTESTATLARSGGTEGYGGGVYTARWGANSATFDVGNGSEDYYTGAVGDGYWFADVVDWINNVLAAADPGWSATVDDNSSKACTGTLPGRKGQGFDDTDCKTTPLSVLSKFDKHGDFYQQQAGHRQNVIVAQNRVVGAETQCIFLCPINNGSCLDMLFANNLFMVSTEVNGGWSGGFNSASQLGRQNVLHSHVVIAHNSWINQELWIRTDNSGYDLDPYCLVANNVVPAIKWYGGAVDTDVRIADNHLFADADDPPNATGTTIGGSHADLFVDAAGGDFAPAGQLLASRRGPVLALDNSGVARGALASPGAVAA